MQLLQNLNMLCGKSHPFLGCAKSDNPRQHLTPLKWNGILSQPAQTWREAPGPCGDARGLDQRQHKSRGRMLKQRGGNDAPQAGKTLDCHTNSSLALPPRGLHILPIGVQLGLWHVLILPCRRIMLNWVLAKHPLLFSEKGKEWPVWLGDGSSEVACGCHGSSAVRPAVPR